MPPRAPCRRDQGSFVAMPCPARRRTASLPRAAGCMSPRTLRTHATTFRCTAIPYRARAVRPRRFARGSRCAPDAPIAAEFLTRASPTPNSCRWALSPGFAVLESCSVLAGREGLGQDDGPRGGAGPSPLPPLSPLRPFPRCGACSALCCYEDYRIAHAIRRHPIAVAAAAAAEQAGGWRAESSRLREAKHAASLPLRAS
jgi:hypothetical protein